MNKISTLECPFCGFEKEEEMPTDSCQFFYKCNNCNKVIKPKSGDCCVYCSYGTNKCPPNKKTHRRLENLLCVFLYKLSKLRRVNFGEWTFQSTIQINEFKI